MKTIHSYLLLFTALAAIAGTNGMQAEEQTSPRVKFRDAVKLSRAQGSESGQPIALASADFDEDGVPDLVTSYADAPGGRLSVRRGNIDAIYPNSADAQTRRQRGEFTDAAFMAETKDFRLPEAADLIGAGDFDADGHWDIVAARTGGDRLFWLSGDGNGNFSPAQVIELHGTVTALVTGEMNRADGLMDIAVAVITSDGPRVWVFECPEGALRGAPEGFTLSAPASALALGQLDDDHIPDLAIASGNEVTIVHGRDRKLSLDAAHRADVKAAQLSRTVLPSAIMSMAIGDFASDSRPEIAVLTADARVRVLERHNETPGNSDGDSAFQASDVMTLGVAENAASTPSSMRLLAAKVSSLPKDDLVVFGGSNDLRIVTTREADVFDKSGKMTKAGSARMSIAASLPSQSEVTAVLPMRLNADALKDLVLLNRNIDVPLVMVTQPAAIYVVNIEGNTNDLNPGDGVCLDSAGNCSFSAAIQEANAHSGADTITFNIPGGGVHMITHFNQQRFNEAVTIDGTTQPDGRIEIVANGDYPIALYGGNSVLRGFAVYGSNVAVLVASDGSIVEGNYVGFRADGTVPVGFGSSGSGITVGAIRGDNNLIGGTTAQARNVISNCALALQLANSVGNVFQGNYIGTNVAGTAAFSNPVALTSFGGAFTIGGATSGAGNLISGNSSTATLLVQNSAAIIQGNLIGTTADGTQPIANSGIGIDVSSNEMVTIGGTTPAARNVIAANPIGIVIVQDEGGSKLVQGNFIGTNAAGTGALPNLSHGIQLRGSLSALKVTIGGVVAGAGNLISGNGGDGISVAGGINGIPSHAVIQGNLIGTDVNGVVAIPNTGNGIQLPSASGTMIGGTSPEARNVISGNHANGIRLGFGTASSQITGNYIGLNRFGTGALGNNGAGLFFENFTGLGNTVGGTASGSSNNIAFNGGAGVASANGYSVISAVVANSIHDNAGLGIDLSNNGVTKNTPGSNSNFPVITSAETPEANSTIIQGTLQNGNYTAGITYTIQFFSNANVDPSGYGEGQTYIGQTTIITDGTTSPHPFSLTVTPAVAPGRFITAVASGKDQFNQEGYEYLSEFSFPARVTGMATPQNTPLLIHLATPNAGGNTGTSTVTIIGEGIQQGATVVLRRAGQPDIIGTVVFISADGSSITVRFNLLGRLLGAWDLVVTNPGGPASTLPGGYNVEVGHEPQIWADLLGRTVIRPNQASRFTILCGNSGNTDAYGVPVFITGIPADAVVELGFDLLHIPRTAEMYVDPNDVPAVTQTDTEKTVALIVPVIPAGGVRTFAFTVTVPGNHTSVTIKVAASSPLLQAIGTGTGGPLQLTVSEAGVNCLTSIVGTTIGCAAGYIPGLSMCSMAVIDTAGFLNTLGGIILGDPQGASLALSVGQLFTATITTSISLGRCFSSVTPLGPLINTVSCGLAIVSTLNDCAPAGGQLIIDIRASRDPNDKVGSHGSGAAQYVTGQEPFRYAIYFENQPTATAPAQEVVITDQLDVTRFDLTTFQLGSIAFGRNAVLSPPPGSRQWTAEVDLRPGNNLIVRVIAALDQTTGLVTWHFFSLDPVTRQPTQDPLAGFLPPNQTAPEGDGVVTFTVKARANLATGTQINNQAHVIFDTNPTIDTPTWLNTIDNSPPSSEVQPLPAMTGSSRFAVSWSGTDTGAGVRDYTIYVSVDGGAYTIWLENTSLTSAFFDGIPGRTYSFYSVARDRAGNLEAPPGPPDTTTMTPTAGNLLNISTRLRVQTGENVLIGGFIISGTDPKRVLIRGIGPSLGTAGVPGALADPTLELHQGAAIVAANDNWRTDQEAEIIATGIPPSNDLESAIIATLNPGVYTAILAGKDSGIGIGLIEAYDLNQAAHAKLANISTRGFVETGDDVLIGGCILGGSGNALANSRVVVRAIGPSLSAVGITGALLDPTLELKDANGTTLISNDDWQQSQQREINATGLAPTNFRESAVIIYLSDGNYTAIVRGKDNTTGVGLVEVYNLQ